MTEAGKGEEKKEEKEKCTDHSVGREVPVQSYGSVRVPSC